MALNITYMLRNLKWLALSPPNPQNPDTEYQTHISNWLLGISHCMCMRSLKPTMSKITEEGHLIGLSVGILVPRSEGYHENYEVLLQWSCL